MVPPDSEQRAFPRRQEEAAQDLSRSKALRLSPGSARAIAREIAKAGGREVCFLAQVSPDRWIVEPRAVSRGNKEAVIAAARGFEEGGVMIHNHPSGVLDPSDADLAVAARIFELGLGTAITTNDADALYVVVEPPPPRVVTPLNLDALEEVLSPSGNLAEAHPRYEDRPGQREMLRKVGDRFNGGHGLGRSRGRILGCAHRAAFCRSQGEALCPHHPAWRGGSSVSV